MAVSSVHFPRRHGRGASTAGFTLIEIMVVVVVIGILAGVLVPQLGGSAEETRLESASRGVADMMDYCYHAASATGRVHALLIDTAQRRMDVVAEATPAPAEEPGADGELGTAGELPPAEPAPTPTPAPTPAAPADPAAAAVPAAPGPGTEAAAPGTDPAAASDSGPPLPVITPIPDPNAPINLVPVSIPGFMDRTLPEGITIATMETYETGMTEGQNEGQFKILFFPDGTTEFAKIELTSPGGRRRQVWLNGLGGMVSVVDPERTGDMALLATITDEDNPDNNLSEDEAMIEPEATPLPDETPLPPAS